MKEEDGSAREMCGPSRAGHLDQLELECRIDVEALAWLLPTSSFSPPCFSVCFCAFPLEEHNMSLPDVSPVNGTWPVELKPTMYERPPNAPTPDLAALSDVILFLFGVSSSVKTEPFGYGLFNEVRQFNEDFAPH